MYVQLDDFGALARSGVGHRDRHLQRPGRCDAGRAEPQVRVAEGGVAQPVAERKKRCHGQVGVLGRVLVRPRRTPGVLVVVVKGYLTDGAREGRRQLAARAHVTEQDSGERRACFASATSSANPADTVSVMPQPFAYTTLTLPARALIPSRGVTASRGSPRPGQDPSAATLSSARGPITAMVLTLAPSGRRCASFLSSTIASSATRRASCRCSGASKAARSRSGVAPW